MSSFHFGLQNKNICVCIFQGSPGFRGPAGANGAPGEKVKNIKNLVFLVSKQIYYFLLRS